MSINFLITKGNTFVVFGTDDAAPFESILVNFTFTKKTAEAMSKNPASATASCIPSANLAFPTRVMLNDNDVAAFANISVSATFPLAPIESITKSVIVNSAVSPVLAITTFFCPIAGHPSFSTTLGGVFINATTSSESTKNNSRLYM